MSNPRSKTRSRCSCGHRIVLVNGHWQHEIPHPEHACSCKEPKPSDKITTCFNAPMKPRVQCGIATPFVEMHHREIEAAQEFQYMVEGP